MTSKKRDWNLAYLCSLIECIGRMQKIERDKIVKILGTEQLKNIYNSADVLHTAIIENIASDYIDEYNIPKGNYDNTISSMYEIPSFWTVGNIFETLIQDIHKEEPDKDFITIYVEILNSWIGPALIDFNDSLFFHDSSYIHECYKKGDFIDSYY